MICTRRSTLALAALLACAGSALAQHSSTPIAQGPFNNTAGTQFNTTGINLNDPANGGPVAAGTYVWYSISLDFSGSSVAANMWSSECRVILADVATVPAASTTVPSPAIIYAGGNATNRGGVAAPNGQGNVTARSVGWKGPMTADYTTDGSGTAGLYMYTRQSFSGGTNPGPTWANLQVKLFTAAPAAPANDLCAGTIDVSTDANTALASPGTWASAKFNFEGSNPAVEVPEPTGFTCTTSARKVMWFKYTPAVTGSYQVSTCTGAAIPNGADIARSSFAVYTTADGLCPATSAGLTLVTNSCATATCFPTGLTGTQANVNSSTGNITLNAGTTYYILVGRQGQSTQTITNLVGAQEENYQFAITRLPAAPANDTCAGAIDLTADITAVIPVAPSPGDTGSYTSPGVNIQSATPQGSGGDTAVTCSTATAGYTIWYTFVAPRTGLYTVSTCAADAPLNNVGASGTSVTILNPAAGPSCPVAPFSAVICGTGTGSPCGSARATVTTTLTAGNTYYMVVGRNSLSGLGAGENTQQFKVTFTEPFPAPANDDCANAIDISTDANTALGSNNPFLSTAIDMRGASTLSGGDPAFCSTGSTTRSVWYNWTPDTTGIYRLSTCSADAPANSSTFTVIGAWTGTCGGALTRIACGTNNCTPAGGSNATAEFIAGTTYRIVIARNSAAALAPAEQAYQFQITKVTEPACTAAPDRTTNNYFNKATATVANSITLTPGQIICGRTTGTTTVAPMQLGSANYWRIATAQAGGITRYRLNYSSLTPGHVVTIRGLTQSTGGVINAGTDATLQTLPTALNRIQWYGLGNVGNPELFVAVTGGLATTLNYNLALQADPVTPIAGPNLLPGSITITSVGQTGGTQIDTDMWVYDSDFNPIPGYGNDDQIGLGVGGSTLTKTFAPGTYYLAMTRYNLANNQQSLAANDNFTTGVVADFPGVVVQGLIAPAVAGDNTGVRFTDSSLTPVNVASSVLTLGDINFIQFTVATPAAACNSADIAQTDASVGFDQCVNNGDFSLFFAEFFSADCTATCGILPVVACNPADIAATDGTPGADGCVDNGDFSLFFSDFFSAVCPNCAG